MEGKIYGVIGCGWLGLPVAKKWVDENKNVIGSTTSIAKIDLLESSGIKAYFLKDQVTEDTKKWIKKIDVLLLCIPPSKLKEKYDDFLLSIVKQLNSTAKIVMISSTSVYANNNQIANEEYPINGTERNAPYVIKAEHKLNAYAAENITIIRMSGLVGKGRNPVKYMQDRSIPGGNEPVNLIHLTDCIGVIEHVINNAIWGETINASAPFHPSKKEFYTYSAKQLNLEAPRFDENPQDSKKISSNKLIKKFGYKFVYPDPYIFPEK